jgi:hypothetical protein
MTERENPVTLRGTEITDERAERIADEAERGEYDFAGARRQRKLPDGTWVDDGPVVGRPSLSGEPGRSPMLTVRVPAALAEQARALAERDGKSVSDVLREALEAHVAASA